jgi:hypothetical protein
MGVHDSLSCALGRDSKDREPLRAYVESISTTITLGHAARVSITPGPLQKIAYIRRMYVCKSSIKYHKWCDAAYQHDRIILHRREGR